MSATASFYENNAKQLAEQYDSLDFEAVHNSWRAYWPEPGATILDVGAGSGRDARWFDERGCSVVAVEPSRRLRQIGKLSSSSEISWLNDSLPHLKKASCHLIQYDLVLLSAVWMHLPVNQRAIAMRTLSGLLSDNGNLVITLRCGEFKDGRRTFGVSVSELEELSNKAGLVVCHVVSGEDSLKRENVTWQTVVMKKVSQMEG